MPELLKDIDKNTNKVIEVKEIQDALKPNGFLSKPGNIKALQNMMETQNKSELLKSLESSLNVAYNSILLKANKTDADRAIINLYYNLIGKVKLGQSKDFDRESNLDGLNTNPSLNAEQRKQLNTVIENNFKSILPNLKANKWILEDPKKAFSKSYTGSGKISYLNLQNSSQEQYYFNENQLTAKGADGKTVYDILDSNEDAFIGYLNGRFKTLYDKEMSSKSIVKKDEKGKETTNEQGTMLPGLDINWGNNNNAKFMEKVFNDRINDIMNSIKNGKIDMPDNYKPFKVPSRDDHLIKSIDNTGSTVDLTDSSLYFDYAGLGVKPIFSKDKVEYGIGSWTFKTMNTGSNPQKIADYLNSKWKNVREQYSKEKIRGNFDTNFEAAKKTVLLDKDISKSKELLDNMEQYLNKNNKDPKYQENLSKFNQLKKMYDVLLVGLDKTGVKKFDSDYKNANSKLNDVIKILKDNSSNRIDEISKQQLNINLEDVAKILSEMENRLSSQTDKNIVTSKKSELNNLRKKYSEIVSGTGGTASGVDSDLLENLYTEDMAEAQINRALDPKNIDAELEGKRDPISLIKFYSDKINSYNENGKKFAGVKEQFPKYMSKLGEEIFQRLKGQVPNGNKDDLRQSMLVFANLMRGTAILKDYKARSDSNSIYEKNIRVKELVNKNIDNGAIWMGNDFNDTKLSKEILSYLAFDPNMGIKGLLNKVDIVTEPTLKDLESRKTYLDKFGVKMTDGKVMRKDPKNPNGSEIVDQDMTNIMTKKFEDLNFKEKIVLQSYKDYADQRKPTFPIVLDTPDKIQTFAERFGNVLDNNFKGGKHIQQLDKQNISSGDLGLNGTDKEIFDTLRGAYGLSSWQISDESFYKTLGYASMGLSMAAGIACMFIPFGQGAGALLLSMAVASLVGITADQLLNDDSNENISGFKDMISQFGFDMVSAVITLGLSTKAAPLIKSIPRLEKLLATGTKNAKNISKIIDGTIDFVDMLQGVGTELARQDMMYGNAFSNPDLVFNQLGMAVGMQYHRNLLKIPGNVSKYISGGKSENLKIKCQESINEIDASIKEINEKPGSNQDKQELINKLENLKKDGKEVIKIIDEAKNKESSKEISKDKGKQNKESEIHKPDQNPTFQEIKFDGGDYSLHVQNKLSVENCQIPLKDNHHEYHLFDKNGKEVDRKDLPESTQKQLTIEIYKNSTKQNQELLQGRDCVNKSGFGFSKDLKVPGDNDLVVSLNKVFEKGEIKQEFKEKIYKLVEAIQKGEIENLKFTHNVKQKDVKVDFSKMDLNNMDWDAIWKDIKPMIEDHSLRINFQNKVEIGGGENKGVIDTEIFIEDGSKTFEIDTNNSVEVDIGDGIIQRYPTPEGYVPYARDLIATDLQKEFGEEAYKLKIAKRIDDMMDAIDVMDITNNIKKPKTITEKAIDIINWIGNKLSLGKKPEPLGTSSVEKMVDILKSSDRYKDNKHPLNNQYKEAVDYLTDTIKAQRNAPKGGETFTGSLIEFRMITEKLKSDIKEYKNNPNPEQKDLLKQRIDDIKKYDFTDDNKFAFFNEVHLLTTQDSYSLEPKPKSDIDNTAPNSASTNIARNDQTDNKPDQSN